MLAMLGRRAGLEKRVHPHPFRRSLEDGSRPQPGSVGVLHPNTECRIVEPATGADVREGEAGEIW